MNELTLTAPEPVAIVRKEAAAGLVPLSDEIRAELRAKVDGFMAELVGLDAQSPAFGTKVTQIAGIGQKEIDALAGLSSRFLDRPAQAMTGEGSVGQSLTSLRTIVETLDPAREGDLLQPRKLFGILPFGNRLKAYFDRYTSAQGRIQAILTSLSRGRDELLQDNIAIMTERGKMWEQMGRLERMIVIVTMLDSRLDEKAGALDISDPARATALRESALFHVRQRRTDLLTQMAVSVQAYLALDLIRNNNLELIKGIDRASTTTIAALRTAVTVAQALTSQRLVLERIGAVSAAAATIIDTTGDRLRETTGAIHDQAASAVQVEALRRAFANLHATMDSVDTFRFQALGNMRSTIEALSVETEKAQDYIARSQRTDQGISLS